MMSSTPETDLEYSATRIGGDASADVVLPTPDTVGAAAAATEVARKPRASRRVPKSDAVLEAAVDRARLGLLEVAPEAQVGRHVSATIDGERLVTHRFEAFVPGYAGWQWYATIARVSRSKDVTVCEVGLLPGAAALLAPEWLPWSERVRPEDSQPEDGSVPATAEGTPEDRPEAAVLADVAETAELAGAAEMVAVAGAAEIAVELDDDTGNDTENDADVDATEDVHSSDGIDTADDVRTPDDNDSEERPDAG